MLRVGLTGSIAVGKSFVSQVLAELGCRVIDADQTAREVVAVGSEGLAAVVAAFGAGVVTAEGALDRAALGRLIFTNSARREELEAILHPRIFAAQDAQLERWEADEPTVISVVDAALMIESGSYKRFAKIIVVWCQPETQLARLMQRNNLTETEALQRIAAQMPQTEKKRYGDFLIDTSAGFDDTRRQTELIYSQLTELGGK